MSVEYKFCLPDLLDIVVKVSPNLNSKYFLFPLLLSVFSSLFDCEFDSCGQFCNTSCFQLNLCSTFDPDGQCVQLHSNSQPYIKQGVHKCYFNPIKHIHINGQLHQLNGHNLQRKLYFNNYCQLRVSLS